MSHVVVSDSPGKADSMFHTISHAKISNSLVQPECISL